MLTQTEIEVLSCFFPKLSSLTSKEIELRAGLSHEPTFRILKGLVKNKYLQVKNVGKTNVFCFVKEDPSITYLVFVYHIIKRRLAFKEKHLLIYKRIYELINEIKPEGMVIIFGSYAKGTESKNSDIDLLITTKNGEIEKAVRIFKTKYNLNIQSVVVQPEDFRNIRKDNPEFWEDLINYGIVFDGVDHYFKEVFNND